MKSAGYLDLTWSWWVSQKNNEDISIKVSNVTHNEDGTADVEFEVTDEFIEWFKNKEGLKNWSQKRFQKFFNETVVKKIKTSGEWL